MTKVRARGPAPVVGAARAATPLCRATRAARINLTSGGSSNRVLGSTAGSAVACRSGTGSPATAGATVTGSPALAVNVNPYNDGVTSIFNVSQNELVSLANVKVPDVASLPPTLPGMSLIVIQGNATFTTARPLVGSGILAVFGNLTVPAGSVLQRRDLRDRELLAVRPLAGQRRGRRARLDRADRAGRDITEVDWDEPIVQQVRNALGGYRFSRTEYVIP